ncbi:MAG: ATP-binding protein [Flavobacteriaceae bacterium]|jgi:NadR type nicotinamide-nucleotide adenylyltransferase|nr:ATP-binding protein [Flavobacteriaceae bacterium]
MEEKLRQEPTNIIKIVLFGPESTGKTTLSKLLANHFKTEWVPEFAREYLQNKWDLEHKTCENHDLLPIAIGQIQLENELAKKADKLLICDTDILETMVYSLTYYGGEVDPVLEKAAIANSYDLYLLTSIDIPWEKDDLRDRPEQRQEMFNAFEKALIDYHKPYVLLTGDTINRFKKVVKIIDKLLAEKNLYT